jgi:CubicO group peptidase (beta-lactamase class C family)
VSELHDRARRQGVSYVDRWVAYQHQLRDLPGVVVGIQCRAELLLLRAYGFADLEKQVPMTPEHIFRIASHSKTFTATAIMQLVERGALRLDDRIGQYLPWLEEGEAAAATVRQLLSHAAGLIRDGSNADHWQLYRPFPDVDELRRMVEDGGQVLPANDSFKYSNIGYSLLGLAIEAAGGMPYKEYVTKHIVRPLGLVSTGPETDEGMRDRLVTGYARSFPGFTRTPLPDVETGAMAPATGFYSTAADLCRYASAHFLGNGRLLSDASKREMQQPAWAIDLSDERYGLGFAIAEVGARRMVGHGGTFPGHATRTLFDPHDELAVVVLVNESGGPAKTLATAIVKIIDFALNRSTRRTRESYERFTGRFVNIWGVTDVTQLGSALVLLSPESDDPVKDVTELEVVDGGTLRITKTGGYGSPGQTLQYVRNGTGRLEVVNMAGLSTYPEDVYRERQGSK